MTLSKMHMQQKLKFLENLAKALLVYSGKTNKKAEESAREDVRAYFKGRADERYHLATIILKEINE
jgi:hypothetical protein